VHGPIKDIREEVQKRIWQLGQQGGYFCGPDQGMPWPETHIQALHEAVEEFGKYPLRSNGNKDFNRMQATANSRA
jgi:hypothetical protein